MQKWSNNQANTKVTGVAERQAKKARYKPNGHAAMVIQRSQGVEPTMQISRDSNPQNIFRQLYANYCPRLL